MDVASASETFTQSQDHAGKPRLSSRAVIECMASLPPSEQGRCTDGMERKKTKSNGMRTREKPPEVPVVGVLQVNRRRRAEFGTAKSFSCDNKQNAEVELTPVWEDSVLMQKLRSIMTVDEEGREQLGVGADFDKTNPHGYPRYKDMALVTAWKVQNLITRDKYDHEKAKLRGETSKKHGGHVTVKQTDEAASAVTHWANITKLDPYANEKYFFHGTKPEFLKMILCEGLNKGGGLFGPATYLGDTPSKMDQYTTTDSSKKRVLEGFEEKGMPYEWSRADVFYGFLVRTSLGNSLQGKCQFCYNSTKVKKKNGKGERCLPDAVDEDSTSEKKQYEGNRIAFLLPENGTYTEDNSWKAAPLLVKDGEGRPKYKLAGEDPIYHSLYARKKAEKTCLRRFSEVMVPLDSHRMDIEFLLVYHRCENILQKNQTGTRCQPVKK